jgi:hypothetical protein
VETDLESLSSHELHDRAVKRAVKHLDVEFLWQLLRAIPAAEALEGNAGEAGNDLTKMSAMIADALGSGEGEEADALRPLYIDYLRKHGEKLSLKVLTFCCYSARKSKLSAMAGAGRAG